MLKLKQIFTVLRLSRDSVRTGWSKGNHMFSKVLNLMAAATGELADLKQITVSFFFPPLHILQH